MMLTSWLASRMSDRLVFSLLLFSTVVVVAAMTGCNRSPARDGEVKEPLPTVKIGEGVLKYDAESNSWRMQLNEPVILVPESTEQLEWHLDFECFGPPEQLPVGILFEVREKGTNVVMQSGVLQKPELTSKELGESTKKMETGQAYRVQYRIESKGVRPATSNVTLKLFPPQSGTDGELTVPAQFKKVSAAD